MRVRRIQSIFLLGIFGLFVLGGCSSDEQMTNPAAPHSAAVNSGANVQAQSDLTPFQLSVQNTIAERSGNGLPVPQVSFSYSSNNGVPLSGLQAYAATPGESFTITAITTFQYDNPAQAGLDQWPPFVITGQVPPELGYIHEGDYTQAYMDYIAERSPGFWDTYEYGYEPRTRTVTEVFTVTYPNQSNLTVGDDLVHGFTFTGPNIDYTISNEACALGVCAWKFKAGFALDWGFGVRLPMNVSLTSADPVNEGTLFTPTSSVHGVDWSAADYTNAGIQPESGNEYVSRFEFFLGLQLEIAEVSVLDIGPDINKDASSSFVTPFGPGAVFNLPALNVPIYQDNLPAVDFEFGAEITPQAGSDKFKANWMASSDLMGSGMLTYTDPNVSQNLNNILAVDGPAVGNVQIKDTEYVFNQFKIALGAYFDIDIIGLFGDHYSIPITDFDLSGIFPSVSVPIHAGSSPTTVNASINVQNVAPTAVINDAGTMVINGVNTFFADVGEMVPLQGSSHDPGRDDLTLEWDFGDGAPTPDTSTNYPLGTPVGPNDVVEDQPHAFADACVYQVNFKSTDSDGASSQDAVAVVIRSEMDNHTRLAGYWQHQLHRVGALDFTDDELGCLLEIVGFMSTVFNEERDASTQMAAYHVLHLAGNHGSETAKLDRALLVAWLNFANGSFDLAEMVDTDGDMIPDATFGGALATAEMVRLDPMATAMQLHEQTEIVHYISTQNNGGMALSTSGSKRRTSDSSIR